MRYFLTLLASAVAAYVLGFVLTVPANPELRVWQGVDQRRKAELAEVRAKSPDRPVIFFTGGSSTAFSIDPAIIEGTCGMPAFNFALPASAGAHYLLHQALEQTKSGDVLVIGLEPDFFAYESDNPAGSLAFGLAVLDGQPSATVGGDTFGNSLSLPEYMTMARPGPKYLVTLLYRSASGKGYRYTPEDYRYHGRMETPVKEEGMPPLKLEGEVRLAESGRKLLQGIKAAADKRGVRLCYTMPWRWTLPEDAAASREANAALLRDIGQIIEVVDDGTNGVATDASFFSDTPQHLTAAGSEARSRTLAPALKLLLSSP
ncbi:hypothetical protein OKA04_10600 [Luteolibacter flavescens]|uniref:SGNH/GDSL hydrolase family protein n=1 Tax=Luteolibacter flavescens TaxID=1859460 RepID=A0ABT3FNN2_9BACT|nr:hypothetical protein [Luteolibacter flavescens]MCW1885177.1 hypothetical protein [Luteolibacter flavescens]